MQDGNYNLKNGHYYGYYYYYYYMFRYYYYYYIFRYKAFLGVKLKNGLNDLFLFLVARIPLYCRIIFQYPTVWLLSRYLSSHRLNDIWVVSMF